jgi:hypothetical protein
MKAEIRLEGVCFRLFHFCPEGCLPDGIKKVKPAMEIAGLCLPLKPQKESSALLQGVGV